MKLSNREKVLILILIITVLGYFGIKFLPSSDLFNLEALREEYNTKNNEYNFMSQNIILKTKYEENLKSLAEEIDNLEVISDLDQEKLIVFLNNYFSENNIDANNINFTDAEVVPMNHIATLTEIKTLSSFEKIINDINGTTVKEESTKNEEDNQVIGSELTDNTQQSSLSVRSIMVNITFESTYNDIIKFIDAIQNNHVDMSINNINIVSTGGDILQGTMIMTFYEVPKPEGFEENNDEWIWKDLVKSGKSNPFSSSSALLTENVGNYDFHMSLYPYSSDLPTITIGKTGDQTRDTYVSVDNNYVVNAGFEFKYEDNKYYYKYEANNKTYPSTGWQEFSPLSKGNINVKVFSSSRNSDADLSGINISVSNTSGLKVRFDIENDDKSNSRIYFKDPRSIIVTRK